MTKQNTFAGKPKGQTSKFHINTNFPRTVCPIQPLKKSVFLRNFEELCDKRHIVLDIAPFPSIHCIKRKEIQ